MRFPARVLFVVSVVAIPASAMAQTTATIPMAPTATAASVPAMPAVIPGSTTVPLAALVDLHKASVSDDVLLALIDSSMTVYQLTATDVRGLRDAGFSDKLIIGILNTAPRARAEHDQQLAAVQQLWAQQAQEPVPPMEPIGSLPPPPDPVWNMPSAQYMASPVYVAPTLPYSAGVLVPVAAPRVASHPTSHRQAPAQAPVYVVVPPVRPAPRDQPVKAPEYWGFGGQLRPDAWKEPGRGGGL